MLYLGYGSNLDAPDLARWCRENGRPPVRLDRVAPAFLPDRRLAFSHRSTTRGGGVLDVAASTGSAVAGVMFREPSPEALETLDLKESRGHAYRRIETVALTADGAEHPVFTYEVHPAGRLPYVPPPAGYLDVVRRGYRAHELAGDALEALEAAARGEPHPGAVLRLFVYGTLRAGEERHPILLRHGAGAGELATVDGTLLDFGDYPGMVLDGGGRRIVGELHTVRDPGALIRELDPIEGSLYRRAVVRAEPPEGGVSLAWAYVYTGAIEGAPTIASGDWRGRSRS